MTQDQLLYSFVKARNVDDDPESALVRDSVGNLYGTTDSYGDYAAGNVFELSPQTGGGWAETVLHNFTSKNGDGQKPSGLILDATGNLYGVTSYGGNSDCVSDGYPGCGTVFELSPQAGGNWTETILYNFQNNGEDGTLPYGNLALDAGGDLYGTTEIGGQTGRGTIFELSPKSGGGWSETILYTFQDNGTDGQFPVSGLIFDGKGNLFATTLGGGSFRGSYCNATGCGTVFELSPKSEGGWTESVLHSFQENGTDGYSPLGTLVLDAAGNLYGTADSGGASCLAGNGCGVAYELSLKSSGWKEKILHSFGGTATDGELPEAGLIFDAEGNLYGTTGLGGSHQCANGSAMGCGTVYELSRKSGGGWTETILHNFRSGHADGHAPNGAVIFDPEGNLYGTAALGGADGGGVVYTFTP
jgi:uncharacterized repeat protein (TIGR03803 family)